MNQEQLQSLEPIRKALKEAFTNELMPVMKQVFPKGDAQDIEAVIAGEFEIFDKIGIMEGEPTDEQLEQIHAEAEEKLDPHYVSLRAVNNLDDLDDEEEDEFSEKLNEAITGAFEKARHDVLGDMIEDFGGAAPESDLGAMLTDMFTPSEPGARVVEVAFGTFDPDSGEMKETIIRPPGGVSSSDTVH